MWNEPNIPSLERSYVVDVCRSTVPFLRYKKLFLFLLRSTSRKKKAKQQTSFYIHQWMERWIDCAQQRVLFPFILNNGFSLSIRYH